MLDNRTALRRNATNAVAARSTPAEPPGAASIPRPAPDLVLPKVVAEMLGVSTKVLERWRGTGAGPAFVRLSRKTLRYRAADVEAFIAGRVCTSTASA